MKECVLELSRSLVTLENGFSRKEGQAAVRLRSEREVSEI